MNEEILKQTLIAYAKVSNHDIDWNAFQKPMAGQFEYQISDFEIFAHDWVLYAAKAGISAKINFVSAKELDQVAKIVFTPFIVFEKLDDAWFPIIVVPNGNGKLKAFKVFASGMEELEQSELTPALLCTSKHENQDKSEANILIITGMVWQSMVSQLYKNQDSEKVFSPIKRLFRLLGNERKDISYIYIYAVVIGLISLTLPIGVQSIINLISGGRFFNSVVVLIGLVILGVLISGALQIMQMTLVEVLQRRIFAKAAYELAYRIPKIKMEALINYYPPELMNRFFEVINIQKGLPKLLVEISAALLQILFGLLLLSFYHPFFVVFSILMVLMVYLIFYFTGAKGLETSIMESKYKYKAVQWFEELARTLASFKLAGTTNLPLEKTDRYVNNYLIYRKKHFGILVIQYGNILAFKTLVTAGILIIGTVLVVERQITLGQFVASELVIIIVVSALEKIILGIDVVYDILTGVDKLGHLTDLPLERTNGIIDHLPNQENGISVSLRDLTFTYPNATKSAISQINVNIPAGTRFCISGFNDSGKETLAKILGGLYTEFQGAMLINNISFRDIEITHYRDLVSKNFDRSEIFDGTVLENITLNKPKIKYADVSKVLEALHLMDDINALPQGLLTELVGTGSHLSNSVLEKIILARCLVIKPKMLIISYPIFMLEKAEQNFIYNMLMDRSNPMTVAFVTNDQALQEACDLVLVLEKGQLVSHGTFSEVKPYLKGL